MVLDGAPHYNSSK